MYFSIKMGEGCDTMFNFNIFKKDVIFEDIPSSRTNSYTMEFWFYVESSDDFTKGMNLIYEDHMTISTLAHNIDDTNLLMLDTFDGISMSGVTKQYLYNKRITLLDSIFISNPIDYPLFKNIYTDNEHVTIKNGKIYVDSSIAETEGKIYIVINLTDDTPFTLEANFHYLSSDAKFVTFDGQNKTSYLPGQKIIFPDKVEHRNGYLFKGWEYNDTLINSIETYYMGDSDINFVSKYVLEGICLVKFYDGFNNLISEQYVEKGYSAIAPDETLRDKNMDGYTFIEYDICFDNVSSDLEIHAIYERKGEIL